MKYLLITIIIGFLIIAGCALILNIGSGNVDYKREIEIDQNVGIEETINIDTIKIHKFDTINF